MRTYLQRYAQPWKIYMAFNKKTKQALNDIVKSLNARGFVIDEDTVCPSSYTNFSEFVTSKVRALRNRGYRGGDLKTWNTKFKPGYSSYGAVDSSKNIDDKIIYEYCELKYYEFNTPNLTVEKLKYFKLGVLFVCNQCRHESIVKPNLLTDAQLSKGENLTGVCKECNNKGVNPLKLVTY